jgi:hypothetical protein
MNEVFYTVFFGILIGYLAIFWGVSIASVLLNYISDGEKNFKAFYDPVKWGMPEKSQDFLGYENTKNTSADVKFHFGFGYPLLANILLLSFLAIDSKYNLNIGIAITSISAAIFITLRLARKIYRVSTLIKTHVNDKQAHK